MIEHAIKQIADQFAAAPRIWVAYSGGVDSHVLLHSLVKYTQARPIAVHIHHGLQAAADGWVEHCRTQASHLGITIEIIKVDAQPQPGQSPEQAARQARYEAIKNLLKPHDLVLTAHNQDDQAETLLLQLFRGAGPKGLAAMPALMNFGVGQLSRPLLAVARADIEAYATAHQLHWVEDPTNLATHYDRNFLRNDIIPLIKQRWPSLNTVLSRSSLLQSEASELLEDLAEQDCVTVQGSKPNTLSVSAILKLSKARQRNSIRHWIHTLNLPTPTQQQLAVLLHDVLTAEPDKNPLLHWPGAEVRRYRDDIYAMPPLPPFDPSLVLHWNRESPLVLPNQLGTLDPNHPSLPPYPQPVIIRFRQGKERLKLPNRQGSHSLKHLMQEWGIPPWLRDRIPLIYVDDYFFCVYSTYVTNVIAS